MLLLTNTFGQPPFCSSAAISVPGAPASSLLTGSQPAVLKPGVEICAPVWVAVALLATFQPPVAPRLLMSLAPVSADDASPAARGAPARAAAVRTVPVRAAPPRAAPIRAASLWAPGAA